MVAQIKKEEARILEAFAKRCFPDQLRGELENIKSRQSGSGKATSRSEPSKTNT